MIPSDSPRPFETVTPAEVHRRICAGESLTLIDVREEAEWNHCRIKGALWRPLSALSQWGDSLPSGGAPWVLYCHHGLRSAWACAQLASRGVAGLANLSGGIDRWSREVEPGVPRY